jgi:hypothetical protein
MRMGLLLDCIEVMQEEEYSIMATFLIHQASLII